MSRSNKYTKYLNIYKILFKYAFINATVYRISFIVELLVELGYSAALVVFFQIVYSNIKAIGSWTYYEVLFLQGLNIVTSEITLGSFWLFGLDELPRKIKDGDIDMSLIKPFNALFNLSFSRPYFTAIISTIPGIFLMFYAGSKLQLDLDFANILMGLLVFICGYIIAYSLAVLTSSISFLFENAEGFSQLGVRSTLTLKKYPHDIYQGFVRRLLMFVFPVIFITSVPASTIIKGIEPNLIITACLVASLFLLLALNTWNLMIKRYSSASS